MAANASMRPLGPGLAKEVLEFIRSPRFVRGLCTTVVLGATCYGLQRLRSQMRRPRQVQVAGLVVYPVKSCRGHSLQRVEVTPWGLKDDRTYMLVDDKGTFFTQRQEPRLAMIHPDMPTPEGIMLRTFGDAAGANGNALQELFVPRVGPDVSPVRLVKVWDDHVPAVDQGDAAADWLQQFLGKEGLRLVHIDESAHRPTDPAFGSGETGFQDGFPVLVTSQASVEDVNHRVQGVEIALDRWRTNVHIAGCHPFDEDEMQAIVLQRTRMRVNLIKPCARCPIPIIVPNTGRLTPYGEPRRTLLGYRKGSDLKQTAQLHNAHFSKRENEDEVFFGQNGLVECSPGAYLEVGDVADVVW